ncbi:MAG: CDP-alcohol phosphatidyltransferase family protein [Candidatus Limnocylindrales bacterium]
MADGSLLSNDARLRLKARFVPLALALARLGFTANLLTIIGFGIALVAAVLAGLQWWLAAGLVSVFGALFDLFDGAVARATGTASKFGAFLDSTLDRWGEGLLYAGIVAGCAIAGETRAALLAVLTLNSAFMVTFTRARAEGLGLRGEVGIAPRPERVAILGLGLILAGLGGGLDATIPWLQIALGLNLVLTTITVFQRIAYVRRQAGEEQRSIREP